MAAYLFVYGTLRPELAGPVQRRLLAGLRPVGPGAVAGRPYDLGEYPALVAGQDGSRVVGDVLELPDDAAVLAALDDYEDYDPADPDGSLYVRVRRPVRLAGGETRECWLYAYARPVEGGRLIAGGDYARWRRDPDATL